MLNDTVVLITGASSGIGAALAQVLAREQANLVIAARRLDRLTALAEQIRNAAGVRVIPVQCDVTSRTQATGLVARAMEEFGRLDILVNNAGRGHLGAVEDTTDDVLEQMFALNVFPLWYTSRPALRQMKKQGRGHIINIASMAGKLGYPFNSAYVAAKHACVGFTHALRQELTGTDIHATVVCPAGVLTDWASSTEGGPMLPFFMASGPIIRRIAAERHLTLPDIEGVQTPELVAEAILAGIYHPVPEIYTHRGSRELVLLAARDPEAAERQRLAIALGEREAYEANAGTSQD